VTSITAPRRLAAGSALAAATLACLVPEPEPTPEELSLARQVAGLRMLVQAAERGTLVEFDELLVVVDQRVVEELLARAVPVEGVVGGFHLRLDGARAEFRGGLALLNLEGEVRLPERAATATVSVYGGLERAELEPQSGMLRSSVTVFAVDIQKAELLGTFQPARRLTQALADGGLEALLGPIRVPVRVADKLSLPPVRTERVRIAAVELPVEAQVSSLAAFGGKLWIGVESGLDRGSGAACAGRADP
jgi:hypothetical protein